MSYPVTVKVPMTNGEVIDLNINQIIFARMKELRAKGENGSSVPVLNSRTLGIVITQIVNGKNMELIVHPAYAPKIAQILAGYCINAQDFMPREEGTAPERRIIE